MTARVPGIEGSRGKAHSQETYIEMVFIVIPWTLRPLDPRPLEVL